MRNNTVFFARGAGVDDTEIREAEKNFQVKEDAPVTQCKTVFHYAYSVVETSPA